MNVTIAGVGFIGRAWAITFARGGCRVALWARRPEAAHNALGPIEDILPSLEEQDLLCGLSADDILDNISVQPDFEQAIGGASFVQENIAEDTEVKREFFARMDAVAGPDTILASSSSAILPSHFTESLTGRNRCLVVHPINPPFLVPATEVVPASWTDQAVVDRSADLMRKIGQVPIVIRREIAGFVMNRLQGAVLQEAFRLVSDGFADAEDIDIGLRDGLALRWAVMGPFETIDLNAPAGIRQYAERYEPLYESLFESQTRRVPWTGDVLDKLESTRRGLLPQDQLEQRRLWRDMMLARLRGAKTKAQRDLDRA